MRTPKNMTVLARLRDEENVCRREAERHARQALGHIRTRRYYLAIAALIEAEVAHHEAEAVKRARGAMSTA